MSEVHGIGGRCQELALSCALNLHKNIQSNPDLSGYFNIGFMSAGTDGQDGPCEAAGAIVDPRTISQALEQGLEPGRFLSDNDTYNFYRRLNGGQ